MTQRHMPPTGGRPLPSRQQRLPEQMACHQWDGHYHRDVVYPGGVERYQREIIQWQQAQRHATRQRVAASRQPVVDADVAGEEWDEDALYETRPPSSTRRYQTTGEQAAIPAPISSAISVPIRRASAMTTGSHQRIGSSRKPGETAPVRRPAPRPQQQQPERAEEKEPSQQVGSWLLRLGIGMLIALLGWMILVAPFLSWVEHRYQDLRYGTPRAAHLSTVVGHNHDSAQHPTYLEVVNDHGTVLLLEIPAGDLSKAKVYRVTLLIGQGADDTPVDLKLVGNDQTPDVQIEIGQTALTWHNTGKGFEPVKGQ